MSSLVTAATLTAVCGVRWRDTGLTQQGQKRAEIIEK